MRIYGVGRWVAYFPRLDHGKIGPRPLPLTPKSAIEGPQFNGWLVVLAATRTRESWFVALFVIIMMFFIGWRFVFKINAWSWLRLGVWRWRLLEAMLQDETFAVEMIDSRKISRCFLCLLRRVPCSVCVCSANNAYVLYLQSLLGSDGYMSFSEFVDRPSSEHF